jgi:cell division protein FtsW (lipid II flippase)
MSVLSTPDRSAAPGAAAPPEHSGGGGRGLRRPRNAELRLLLLAMVVVAAYAAAVELHLLDTISATFWMPIAVLTALFVAVHITLRFVAPYADPILLPAAALVNGIGVAFLRRLDMTGEEVDIPALSGIGGTQLIWTAVAVAGAIALLIVVRDHQLVSQYAWTLGLVGLVLMTLPGLLPASISERNNAKLWIIIGPFSIQPGEFAKLALLAFFAYYLVRKREVLSLASKRFFGIDFPRGRDLGPVVVVWLMSLMVLVLQSDLGTSLMYFGMFVVALYVATERVSWLLIGLLLFFGGAAAAYFAGGAIGGPFTNYVHRVDVWLDPFSDPTGLGYQPVQGLLALGTGGLFGTGPGAGYPGQVPEVRNDFIIAGLGEEIGLFGLTALLVVYLLIVTRGMKAALAVRDSFGKLLAAGLTFVFGLQIFVIVGGVSGLIPLTGLTTPLMSAGGSALAANWLLVALLLRISNSARRPPPVGGGVMVPPPAPAVSSPPATAPPAAGSVAGTPAPSEPEPPTEVVARPASAPPRQGPPPEQSHQEQSHQEQSHQEQSHQEQSHQEQSHQEQSPPAGSEPEPPTEPIRGRGVAAQDPNGSGRAGRWDHGGGHAPGVSDS